MLALRAIAMFPRMRTKRSVLQTQSFKPSNKVLTYLWRSTGNLLHQQELSGWRYCPVVFVTYTEFYLGSIKTEPTLHFYGIRNCSGVNNIHSITQPVYYIFVIISYLVSLWIDIVQEDMVICTISCWHRYPTNIRHDIDSVDRITMTPSEVTYYYSTGQRAALRRAFGPLPICLY